MHVIKCESYSNKLQIFKSKYRLDCLTKDQIVEKVSCLVGIKTNLSSLDFVNDVIYLISPFIEYINNKGKVVDIDKKIFFDMEYFRDLGQEEIINISDKLLKIKDKERTEINISNNIHYLSFPSGVRMYLSLLYSNEYVIDEVLIEDVYRFYFLQRSIDYKCNNIQKALKLEKHCNEDILLILLNYALMLKSKIKLDDHSTYYKMHTGSINEYSIELRFDNLQMSEWFQWNDYFDYCFKNKIKLRFHNSFHLLKGYRKYVGNVFILRFEGTLLIKNSLEAVEKNYNEEEKCLPNQQIIQITQNYPTTLSIVSDFLVSSPKTQTLINEIQVYKVNEGCATHYSKSVSVSVLKKIANTIVIQDIDVFYCLKCRKYFSYLNVLKKDLLHFEDYLLDIITDNKNGYFSSSDNESVVHKLGYNVEARNKLSSHQRRLILEKIIDLGIKTPIQIIAYLNSRITRQTNHSYNYTQAITKWDSDLNYIKSKYR